MDVKIANSLLRDDTFLGEVRSSLATWGDDVDPGDIDATVAWIDGIRSELATLLDLVGDGDDAGMVCAVKLVEFKSHWIGINTRVNYTIMQGQPLEPTLAFRGAALSALIEGLEPLLPERNVEAYHAMLAEPLTERPTRMLDDVWERARNAKPIHEPARAARGVGSASSHASRRRRDAA